MKLSNHLDFSSGGSKDPRRKRAEEILKHDFGVPDTPEDIQRVISKCAKGTDGPLGFVDALHANTDLHPKSKLLAAMFIGVLIKEFDLLGEED